MANRIHLKHRQLAFWHWACVAFIALAVSTPSNSCAATIFGVIGDYGNGVASAADGAQGASVATMVKGWNPDFILTVGDNNYGDLGDGNGNVGHWEANVGSLYGDYMLGRVDGRYSTVDGSKQTSPTQRFFPAIGNHDSGGPGANGTAGGSATAYLDYFHNNPGGAARLPTGSGQHSATTGTYYDFVQGDAHFFVVDSDRAITSSGSLTAQSAWLQAGLANSTSAWNFVTMHHPPYSSGSHGNETDMQLPYIEWGAHAVFAGHDHNLERIMVAGYPYFVSGGAGRALRPFGTIQPGQAYGTAVDPGALRVSLNGNLATFEFFTPGNATALDSFSLDLNDLPQPPVPPPGRVTTGIDTTLRSAAPTTAHGALTSFGWDQDSDGSPDHALLQFDIPQNLLDAYTAAANPQARLELNITNPGHQANVHLATVDWITNPASRTWDNMPGGPGLVPGANVATTASATTSNSITVTGLLNVDVSADVAAWAAGGANFGWGFLPLGTNGVDITSFESVTPPTLILENRLAGTSFEEPSPGALAFTSTGGELGFTRMIDFNGDGTFGDEDPMNNYGVTNAFATTDGSQSYQVTGSDDGVPNTQPVNKLVFDAVNVGNDSGVTFSIDVFVSDTTWEPEDILKIALQADNGTQVDELLVIDTTGQDIDTLSTQGLVTEGNWRTYFLSIDDQYESVVLELTNSSNSSMLAERFYYDNIIFAAPITAVPEPSSVALGTIGLLFFLALWFTRRRRRA